MTTHEDRPEVGHSLQQRAHHARERGEGEKLDVCKPDKAKSWGRYAGSDPLNVALSAAIMLCCPLLVVFYWIAFTHFGCSATQLVGALRQHSSLLQFLRDYGPRPTAAGLCLYLGWVAFQALLYAALPGRTGYGQRTPAGLILPYKVNGLRAWIVSHALYIGGSLGLGLFSPTLVYDNWGGLLVATNIYGYALTLFAYAKAHLFPSHPEDRKFSGSRIYDLYMGIELNPRFGHLWDFKLFHNGRPGIIGWTLINFSFAAAQYAMHGRVSNSMVLLNLLHLTYVLDYFRNEDWYLRTIDIAHDHFGFYLAWGDSVWLPFMYTLQSHYLVRHPEPLSWLRFALILALGLAGYAIFRLVNSQKDRCRRTHGKCFIWGKPARCIRAPYTSSDGKEHEALLLCSGFWGISRHFNYVGDLMLSAAMCLACGFRHIMPYFYIVYMTILLVHRVERDNARCKGKYGKMWDEYCKQVPYKIMPFIY